MALIRFLQSSFSNSFRREIAPEPYLLFVSQLPKSEARSDSHSLKRCAKVPGLGGIFKPSAPGNCFQPGMVSSVGVPTKSNMILSWLGSLSPESIGLPTNISPKTHLREVSIRNRKD
jgi:hypothetical protein